MKQGLHCDLGWRHWEVAMLAESIKGVAGMESITILQPLIKVPLGEANWYLRAPVGRYDRTVRLSSSLQYNVLHFGSLPARLARP